MPYDLMLKKALSDLGWKVKIREKERLEPPHATVIFRTRSWRWNLRTQKFMDKHPPAKEVPAELVKSLEESLEKLIEAWNKKYPHNEV